MQEAVQLQKQHVQTHEEKSQVSVIYSLFVQQTVHLRDQGVQTHEANAQVLVIQTTNFASP